MVEAIETDDGNATALKSSKTRTLPSSPAKKHSKLLQLAAKVRTTFWDTMAQLRDKCLLVVIRQPLACGSRDIFGWFVNNKFLVVKLLRALGGCLGTRRR